MDATPPALTPSSFREGRSEVQAHDHAVCTYTDPEQLDRAIHAFVREGVARRELCVFVHAFSTEAEAWKLLERGYRDASKLRSDQLVVVSLYKDAFQGPSDRIDYAHVTRVLDSLIEAARGEGRAGVRIFVDASRVYFAELRSKEWFDFESWLGRRLHQKVGLVCAYRHEDAMRPDIFPDVLRTHAYRFEGNK